MVNVAIVCEGKNDREFLTKLIDHLDLARDRVSFYLFNGKSELLNGDSKKYAELKLEIEAGQISKVLFVVDADNDQSDAVNGGFANSQQALDVVIGQLGFAGISQTYIVCDPTQKTGYLESLILSTIPEAEKNCILGFLKCSEFKSKENHKAILNQIYKMAYPDAPYNFSHPHFDTLKLELRRLFTNPAVVSAR